MHHPYESFSHVVDFIEAAADDERVLAIKQTLYRTSSDSPVVRALQRAADNGKQVTAVIELKARLDEERNIVWARELEKAGVHVVFGFVGLKTHCKVALVVRREDDGIRRYVHLATGNYNPQTARIYTDLGYFTCNPDFCEDASALFNYLTGYCELPQWRKLVVAPSRMQSFMIEKIEQEAAMQKAGKDGRIIAKINGLLEPAIVQALYRASQAGVKIDLICRGICALRPGMPGISDNIRVISIVDRFLEHSRIFYFGNGGDPQVYIGSADWMDRNLSRRVEVVFPIEPPELKQRLIDEILATSLADNVKARELLPDGSYRRVPREPAAPRLRSQERFLEIAAQNAARRLKESAPAAASLVEGAAGGSSDAQTADEVRRAGVVCWRAGSVSDRREIISGRSRSRLARNLLIHHLRRRLDRLRVEHRRGRCRRTGAIGGSALAHPRTGRSQSQTPAVCWQPTAAPSRPNPSAISIMRRIVFLPFPPSQPSPSLGGGQGWAPTPCRGFLSATADPENAASALYSSSAQRRT